MEKVKGLLCEGNMRQVTVVNCMYKLAYKLSTDIFLFHSFLLLFFPLIWANVSEIMILTNQCNYSLSIFYCLGNSFSMTLRMLPESEVCFFCLLFTSYFSGHCFFSLTDGNQQFNPSIYFKV